MDRKRKTRPAKNSRSRKSNRALISAFIVFDIVAVALIVLLLSPVTKKSAPENPVAEITNVSFQDFGPVTARAKEVIAAEKKEKKKSRYDRSVFVGDSLTEGVGIYGFAKTENVVAKKGLNLTTIQKSIGTIAKRKPECVFLMLGINDLNFQGSSVKGVARSYEKVVKKIHKKCPDAHIYIESLLPVTAKFAKSRPALSNKRIVKLNKRYEKLADKYDYTTYVDIHSLYVNKKGNLPAKKSPDGYHLYSDSYGPWINHMKEVVSQ